MVVEIQIELDLEKFKIFVAILDRIRSKKLKFFVAIYGSFEIFYGGINFDLTRSRKFKNFIAIYCSSKAFYDNRNLDLVRSKKFKNFMAIYGSSILPENFLQNKLLFSLSFANKINNL